MANATFSQTNFTAGKIDRLLHGRTDLARRYNGLSENENFISTKHGPATRRPGTVYVADVNTNEGNKRLVPFQFSSDQTYVLEFGRRYMRVFLNRDQLMDDGSLKSAGTSSTPFELETPYTDLVSSDFNRGPGGGFSITSSAGSSISVTGFAWGNTATSGLVPDGIARITLASSAATAGVSVGMPVEVEGITMSSRTNALRVNKSHVVLAVDSDSANNIDVWIRDDPGAASSFSGATIEIPPYVELDSGINTQFGASFTGGLIDVSKSREDGVANRPEYNGRFKMFSSDDTGTGIYKYQMSPTGGTCDALTYNFLTTDIEKMSYAQSADVLFMCHENVRPKELQRISGFKVSDSEYSTMTSGTMTLTIASESEPHPFVPQIPYSGSYSKIIVSGCSPSAYNGTFVVTSATRSTVSYKIPGGDPGALTAFGTVDGWQIVDRDDRDGPYEDDFSADDIDPSMTLTSISAGGNASSSNDVFFSTIIQSIDNHDVDRVIAAKRNIDSDWANSKLTIFSSFTASPVSAKFYGERNNDVLYTDGLQKAWKLGKWSHLNGWPWVVSFFGGRLASAGSNKYPSSFWSTVSNDILNHRPFDNESPYTVAANDAIDVAINDVKSNSIYWMSNTPEGMLIGTDSSEILFKQTSTSEAIGPNNIEPVVQSNVGSHRYIQPTNGENSATIFVGKGARNLYELDFNPDAIDVFSPRDLTILSPSITLSGIKCIEFTKRPHPIVWCLLNNGRISSVTYDKSEQISGWHEHIIAGDAQSGDSNAKVVSIASIHDESGVRPIDMLWMIVKRRVNSQDVQYIEYLSDYFEDGDSLEDACVLDSSVTYDGVSTSTITGLGHLEGQVVSVLADGVQQLDKTVSSSQITLDSAASKAKVGLSYESKMATLQIELPQSQPASNQKVKRLERAHLSLVDSLGVKIGVSETDVEDLEFPSSTQLYTGVIEDIGLKSGYERDHRIWITNSSAYPSTVRSISVELSTQEI